MCREHAPRNAHAKTARERRRIPALVARIVDRTAAGVGWLRFDVLVHVEQVARVVLALDVDYPQWTGAYSG
jgi:hypothetical protein